MKSLLTRVFVVALWGTVHAFGPYAAGQGDECLMLLQVFMANVAGSGLILGATISERDASKARKAGMLLLTAPSGSVIVESWRRR